MKKLANFIRSSAGRKSVPKNYNQHLYEKSNMLEHIYKEGFYEFETSKDGIKQRPVVYATASELVDFVFENRNIEHIEQSKIKVMADGGQDFFKISLSISIPEDDLKENDLDKSKNVSTYSTGGSMANKRKLTSVFKLLLLGIVPRIKETYDNFKILVELTKLNEIPFKFVGDLKLVLLVNGQQTATAFYPCPYCFVTLNELKSYDKMIEENYIRSDDKNLDLKTYKHLKDDYFKFKSLGNDKKKAKECHSTINHPLFIEDGTTEDDNLYVLQKCIPPELHLLQGFVNHLFWDGIVKIEEIGKERALLWPNKLGISHKSYQGDIFEGNQCRKLLKEADKLQDPKLYGLAGPFRLQPYIAAFKAMNKIVEKCFAAKKADITDFNKNLKELREALKSTEISQTLKIHIILEHLEEAIIFLNNDGLGLWSEQAGESVHSEFNKYWDRFKINLLDEPSFINRLKKAVVTFSSQHV